MTVGWRYGCADLAVGDWHRRFVRTCGMAAVIRRLDETVVNRIAAGEVVQRPANALKELLENSLDAGATSISVTLAEGGLKLLQIQDNGCGIRRDDMNIVCERFTTSKLTHFDDLLSIGTFGFRGEALASISHVARLTITTRTADSVCAYRASYSDGQLTGNVQPIAGNVGTLISAADLFYNMSSRRQALRSASEEFSRVADVVARYALHNAGVAFSLKKHGATSVHVRTTADASTLDNIAAVFGTGCSKHLLECQMHEPQLKLNVSGYVSSVNYSAKRFVLVLFINNRLVECSTLRKALEQVYTAYLPRGASPFVYMSLQLPPETVDVNVHPTKSEVNFLHEERIIETVQRRVDAILVGTASARSFYTQTLLPGRSVDPTLSTTAQRSGEDNAQSVPSSDQQTAHPSRTVRVDPREQKIDAFMGRQVMASRPASAHAAEPSDSSQQLTSVLILRAETESACHTGLRCVLAEHCFVGAVNRRVSLLQHGTRLYLVHHERLAAELFRQLVLYQLGSCGRFVLDQQPSIKQLAVLGLQLPEAGWQESDGPREEIAEYVAQLLGEKADLLDEYFSVRVDSKGCLTSLPLLLEGHQPALEGLPIFLLRLATEVDWQQERACLAGIAAELGRFYSRVSPSGGKRTNHTDKQANDSAGNNSDDSNHVTTDGTILDSNKGESPADNDQVASAPLDSAKSPLTPEERWQIEHVLMATCKQQLLPPSSMADDGSFLQVADLPELYKIFERC